MDEMSLDEGGGVDEVQDGRRQHFRPPGAAPSADEGEDGRRRLFGEDFESNFRVPARLADKPCDLVEAVNDFHYAMINDQPRNEFYYQCLQRAIVPGVSIVLEIGTGSGLLAMLAAGLHAKRVIAIEASKSLAELARRNIEENQLSNKIDIIFGMSTEISAEEIKDAVQRGTGEENRLPDVIVSELFGTLLLGESALEYLRDARERLAEPNARIVPPRGTQYAALIECAEVHAITSAADYRGLSLRHINVLQDTSSVVFTKQYGFRFSSVPSTFLARPIPIFHVDFTSDLPGNLSSDDAHSVHQAQNNTFGCQKILSFKATENGTAHCILVFWEVSIGSGPQAASWEQPSNPLTMSTDPRLTVDNFARDMQWGQAIQLIEDNQAARLFEESDPEASLIRQPTLLQIRKGDSLHLGVRLSPDSVVLQFELLSGALNSSSLTRSEAADEKGLESSK